MDLGPKKCRKAVKRAARHSKVARRVLRDSCARCGLCPKLLTKHLGGTPRPLTIWSGANI